MKVKKIFSAITSIILTFSSVSTINAASDTATFFTGNVGGTKANIISIDMKAGRIGEVGLANNSVVDAVPVNDIIKSQGNKYKVLASVNGGYFNAYTNGGKTFPDKCPRLYATVMKDGQLINGGGNSLLPTLGFNKNGKAVIDRVAFTPYVNVNGEKAFSTWGINSFYTDSSAIMHFTDEMTLSIPFTSSTRLAIIKDGIVTNVTTGSPMKVEPGMDILAFNSGAYAQPPAVGSKVSFTVNRKPQRTEDQQFWNEVVSAVSVGPMLVSSGKNVARNNPDFKESKQQPDAVTFKAFTGVMNDGRVIFGTVAASNTSLADYLASNGCKDAMCLDGGASTMLYMPSKGYITQAGRNLANVITIIDKYPATQNMPQTISVLLNGHKVAFSDAQPQIINNRTLVPFRTAAEALGASVSWDSSTSTMTLTKDSRTVVHTINTSNIMVNGEIISFDTPSSNINGRTMMPVRMLAEALGTSVNWDSNTKSVLITS